MYCDFFGLRCRPFEDRADTRFFHATGDADEALAAMDYESHFGKGASLILGAAGTGKTLLVRTLLQRLHTTDHVVVLTWMSNGPTDLIRETCKGFGVSIPASSPSGRAVSRLRRHLLRTQQAEHRSILVIDQVENLTSDNVVQLSTLLNIQHDGQKLLNVILTGQPHFKERLEGSELAGVRQHLYGERTLKALTLPDTRAYVEHRLRVAGAGETNLFDLKAVEQIHRASGGVPRLINHMCEAALLAAYGAGQSTIGEAIAAEIVGQHTPKERTVAVEQLGLGSSNEIASGWQGRQATPAAIEASVSAVSGSSLGNQPTDPIAAPPAWNEPDPDGSFLEPPSVTATNPTATIPDADDGFSVSDEALVRLERALDRAERLTVTSDAAAARCAAVEKHLAKLMSGADRLATTLASSIQRASHSVDSVQARVNRVFDDADTRLSKIDQRVVAVAEASADTEEQIIRLDRACETGRQVDRRLTEFAGRLADKADDVQQHIAGLMTGISQNEEAQRTLTALIEGAGKVAVETDERIQSLHQTLQEGEANAQRAYERLTGEGLDACVSSLEKKAGDYERTIVATVQKTRKSLDGLVHGCRNRLEEELTEQTRSTRDAAATAHRALEQLRTHATSTAHDAEMQIAKLLDSVRDPNGEIHRTLNELIDSGSRQLENELKEKTRSTLDVVATARMTLEDLERRAASTTQDADTRMAQVRTTVEEAGREAAKIKDRIVESAIARVRQQLTKCVVDQISSHEEAMKATVATSRQTMAEATESFDQRVVELEERVSTARLTADEAIIATVVASRQTMAEATESFGQRVGELEERVATARQITDEAAVVCEQSVTSRISEASQDIETLDRQIVELENQRGEAQQALSALKTNIDGSITRVEELDALMEKRAPVVDALTVKAEQTGTQLSATVSRAETLVRDTKEAAEQTGTQLSATVSRAETLVRDTKEAVEQIVTLQQSTSTTLVQLGGVCERLGEARAELRDSEETIGRLGAIRSDVEGFIGQLEQAVSSARPIEEMAARILPEAAEQTQRLETRIAAATEIHEQLDTTVETGRTIVDQADAVRALAGRLTEVQSAGDTTVSQLEQILASAQPLLQAVRQTMSEATEQERRLESTRASITGVLDDLSHATADGRGVAEGIAGDVRKAVEVSSITSEHVARMQATRESGTKIMEELADVIGSAGDMHKSLQGTIAHTDEKLGRLETHGSAAARTLDELSTGVSKGETVAQQLGDATENMRQIGAETVGRIDRTIRDVWDLNTRTDINLKSLTTHNAKAVEVTKELADVLGPAGETLADITKQSSDARSISSAMEEHIDNAVRLSDRIQSLSALLENVQHAEQSAKATTSVAKTTCAELVGATEEAATRCDSLTDLGAHTQGLIETHEQIRETAESVVERLSTQLTAGQKVSHAAQPLLEDFIAQSREIDEHLREAKRESQRIEESVKQSTERPAELVAAAQRQAAELERVCEAVRKVFGGLSKASLEARDDTKEFHRVGQEAQQQFAQIIAEAGGATATLEEWVQEAVLAQTRLARTLEGAPSIQETHPPGAVPSARRVRTVGKPATTGELEVLRSPAALPTTDAKPQTKPTPRAETIARLIEDAKKASAVGSA